MDIYLLDQVLRGRIAPDARVFEGGAGSGRNLRWFVESGFDVRASDQDAGAVRALTALGVADARTEPLESTSFDAESADLVIVNAVLHFAQGPEHFTAMLDGAWRVLAPGGLFFSRLTSSIGLENHEPLGNDRYLLPDGSERFLVDAAQLAAHTRRLGATLADPLKTTNVAGLRCMTTWVLSKPPA
ncbi:MAG: class I SAM-dependent methyltransferase [Planctomycetota bacterium]